MVLNRDAKLRTLAQKPNSPANRDGRLRTGTQKDGVVVVTRSFGSVSG